MSSWQKLEHTPGPWHVGKYEKKTPIRAANGLTVAFTSGVTAVGKHDFANARLIAAAPDLLAALKAMLDPDFEGGDIDAAMTAIRRAEGLEP